MKRIFALCLLFIVVNASAQSKEEIAVLSKARLLHSTVFQTKDSAVLAGLFTAKLSYGHSGGKIEGKEAAISGIIRNQSTYADLQMGGITVIIEDNTAITRHTMTATETNNEGKVNQLKLHIILVWVKEKKDWKLLGRQAIKL